MGNPLPKDHNHKVSKAEAHAQTNLERQGGKRRSTDSGAFLANQVIEMLSQPGCVGLRYYKARKSDGLDSMILVGVDEKGNDMVDGIMLNSVLPCPPWCSDDNELNS